MVALSGGVALWMLFAAGRGRQGGLIAFCVFGFFLTLVLVALTSARPWLVSFALVAGPIALVPWTFDRGDGDGLSFLVIPMLVVVGGFLAGVVDAITSADGFDRREGGIARFLARHRALPLLIACACLLAATLGSALLWPAGWDDLEEVLATFRTPPGFVRVETQREGDQLCSVRCGPWLVTTMTSPLPPRRSGLLLVEAIRAWADDVRWSVDGCEIFATHHGPTPVEVHARVGIPEHRELPPSLHLTTEAVIVLAPAGRDTDA